jgi:phospholipid/cholesterol/gamma-HCH transport system substrate-binding protein
VGKIVAIKPLPNSVEVEAELAPADLIIPKDVVAQVNQSGLISQTAIELAPMSKLEPANVKTTPLDKNCDREQILCNNARLPGESGASVDELVRASVRFASVYTDPKFFSNVNLVVKNTADAAAELTKLTRDARQELKTFSSSAQAISNTAEKLGTTADQVNSLLATNRAALVSTLDNISQTSGHLRSTVSSLGTILNRVEQGQLLQNLEVLSANAAKASANLKAASDALSSPANLLVLQQTLDSARATFQNAQKITADLDELTGDPAFRNNLKNLVNGLSGLVSSTQQLQQQTQTAQILAPISTTLQSARLANQNQIVISLPATLGQMQPQTEVTQPAQTSQK